MRRLYVIFLCSLLFMAICGNVCASQSTYTVKSGDCLWNIANKFGTTVSNLKTINNLNSDRLKVGQQLLLQTPAATQNQSSANQNDNVSTADTATSRSEYYTIRPGDTLSTIAKQFNMTVDQLKSLNGLTSDWIFAGDQLRVNSGSMAVSPSRAGNLEQGALIVNKAAEYLGTPYRYGGASTSGFDCSGFVRFVFSQFGYDLPHNALAQYGQGASITSDNMLPGDLVFFHCGSSKINHVGIYCGNNQFIHSSSPRDGGVIYSSLNSSYYAQYYAGAKRIIH